ncbi:hypothetical protein I4U23_024051 [Adineta vaga]|nr:hypothetical protein I4U23_024051 [Adineta vaga]
METSLNEPYDEKIWSCNDTMKRRLSLKIWLPNVHLNNGDENIHQTATSEIRFVDKNPEVYLTNENRHMNTFETIVPVVQPSIVSKPLDKISSESVHPTISTHYNEQTHTFKIIERSTSTNNLTTDTKSTHLKPISSFVQKYSSLRKDHHSSTTHKSSQIRLPALLDEKTPTYVSRAPSASHQINSNIKLLAHCSTSIKSSYSNFQPQLPLFSLTNQQQPSSSIFLTTLFNKKNDEPFHPLQRSRTFQTFSDISNTPRTSSYTSDRWTNSFHSTTNELKPCLISKRISFTLRSKQ